MSIEKLLKTKQDLTAQISILQTQIKDYQEQIKTFKLNSLTSTANLEGVQSQLQEAQDNEAQLLIQLQQIQQEVTHLKQRLDSKKQVQQFRDFKTKIEEEKEIQNKLEEQISEIIQELQ